jgi:hypothetical protein
MIMKNKPEIVFYIFFRKKNIHYYHYVKKVQDNLV